MVLTRGVFVLPLLLAVSLCGACGDDGGGDGNAPTPDAGDVNTPDADRSNEPDAMPGATLEFMEACIVADDQCDTANNEFCFAFNNKGPHCTHDCGGDGACEAPSPGCNGMGVCKAP